MHAAVAYAELTTHKVGRGQLDFNALLRGQDSCDSHTQQT